jgi:hypothetical protein
MKTLLLAVLFTICSTAWAENWQFVATSQSGTSTITIDKDSIVRKDNISVAQFKQFFPQHNIAFYTRTMYNCNSNVFRVAEAYIVTKDGGKADLVSDNTWKVLPDSSERSARNAACNWSR